MNFGEVLRAARLRWGRLPDPAEGWMRLTPVAGGTLCELRPLGPVPNERATGHEHFIWWQLPDGGRGLIESSPYLRGVRTVTEYTSVVLDAEGEAVR